MNTSNHADRIKGLHPELFPSASPTRYHGDFFDAYREGHDEARKEAVQIAAEADARIERLEKALQQIAEATPCEVMQQDSTMRVTRFNAYLSADTVDAARKAVNNE